MDYVEVTGISFRETVVVAAGLYLYVLLLMWLVRDARKRLMNWRVWLLVVLILNVIGLLAYLVARRGAEPCQASA